MPKGRKKKGSDAWKNILKIHKRGPKRVRINAPRKRKGVDALMIRENVKKVLINLKYSKQSVWAIVFKQKCHELNVSDGTFSMPKDRPNFIAKLLKKGYESFGHNDFILGKFKEFKLERIGRCFLSTGTCENPDIILNIEESQATLEEKKSTEKHIDALFHRNHVQTTRNIKNFETM